MGENWYGKRSLMMKNKDEDFQEADVWGMVDEGEDHFSSRIPNVMMIKKAPQKMVVPSSPRVVQRPGSEQKQGRRVPRQQPSAPMDIPHEDRSPGVPRQQHHGSGPPWVHDDQMMNGGDDVGEMVPPHEYISRRLARNQIASFSMCEGVGRTLKGRDLRKLRNAILTKTGFLE